MTDEAKVIDGRYKGVKIRIDSASLSGGRKHAVHSFPNRDTNFIEDLGALPRSYQLEIIVSDTQGQDYFSYRDSLLSALGSIGTGILEHPIYGRIDNVFCTTFSLSENFTEFGRSVISASFEVSLNRGIPQQTNTSLSQLVAGNAAVISAVNADIVGRFTISNKYKDNFQAGIDKITDMVTAFTDSTSFIGDAASDIDLINEAIGDLSANINSLIVAPQNLADEIGSLFDVIDGATGSTESTAKTMEKLFGFGDDDNSITQNTAGKIERADNNAVLNSAINSQALGYAYTNTAQTEFDTVAEIDTVANDLDDQYQSVMNSDAGQDVKDALTDLRTVVQGFFDKQRLTASQVITIFTPTTSTRLLSFQYYGDSSRGEALGILNNEADVSFISGDVEILTA